jgi:hypothetical protein
LTKAPKLPIRLPIKLNADGERKREMTRNLKVLGLALVAALAVGAVGASAALGNANYWFLSDASAGATTTFKGEQVVANGDRFVIDGGTFKCEATHYTGTQVGPTVSTITLSATYSGCKFGPIPITINMGNCHYLIHTDTNGDTTNGQFDTITTITCTSGDITITASSAGTTKCITHIPAQNLGTGLVATNGTTPGGIKDITGHIDFSTITYTQTGGTGLGACANFGSTETHNGVYEGEATHTGFNEAEEPTDISLSTT